LLESLQASHLRLAAGRNRFAQAARAIATRTSARVQWVGRGTLTFYGTHAHVFVMAYHACMRRGIALLSLVALHACQPRPAGSPRASGVSPANTMDAGVVSVSDGSMVGSGGSVATTPTSIVEDPEPFPELAQARNGFPATSRRTRSQLTYWVKESPDTVPVHLADPNEASRKLAARFRTMPRDDRPKDQAKELQLRRCIPVTFDGWPAGSCVLIGNAIGFSARSCILAAYAPGERGLNLRYAYSVLCWETPTLRTVPFLRRGVTLLVLKHLPWHGGTGLFGGRLTALLMTPHGLRPVLDEVTTATSDSGDGSYRWEQTGTHRFLAMRTDSPRVAVAFRESKRACQNIGGKKQCKANAASWNETFVWHEPPSTFYDADEEERRGVRGLQESPEGAVDGRLALAARARCPFWEESDSDDTDYQVAFQSSEEFRKYCERKDASAAEARQAFERVAQQQRDFRRCLSSCMDRMTRPFASSGDVSSEMSKDMLKSCGGICSGHPSDGGAP
jgi:hypothetical protein